MNLYRMAIIAILTLAGTTVIYSMEKPEINTPQNQQQLLAAIRAGNVIEVNTLLEAGLDPNFNAGSSQNPLVAAINFNNPDIVQLLLQYNADPNSADSSHYNYTPLMKALSIGHAKNSNIPGDDPEARQDRIIQMLLASPKLNINSKNSDGNGALVIAIQYKPKFVSSIVNKKDLNINAVNNFGRTALMLLIPIRGVNEVLPLIRILLSREDLTINLADNKGQTALDYAKIRRSKQIENLLIEHGATAGSPERRKMPQGAYSAFGQAQPQAAAYQAPPAFAQAAQFSARPASAQFSYSAQPASAFPNYSAQPATARAYPAAPPAPQAAPIRTPDQQLYDAVAQDNISAAKALLEEKGANPNATYSQGIPIAFRAMTRGLDMLKLFLVQPSYNPNTVIPANGVSLLSAAISSQRIPVVEALLNDKRINVNLKDTRGMTPMDYAIQSGNQKLINLLQTKGARANKSQMPPQQTKIPAEPIVTEAFAPEVYAALGLQPNTRDAYAILGLKSDSSDNEITKRFRELTVQWHPDKNPDPIAGQAFSLIKNAYEAIRKAREKKTT